MKLWGGRFSSKTDDLMRAFNDSFRFDRRLYAADIQGSVAYAGALLKAGMLTSNEHAQIVEGLTRVKEEFDSGTFQAAPGDEDIHTAVERRLTEIIGPTAGKLHTGRSRNDQVSVDIRLWLVEKIQQISNDIANIQSTLVTQAEFHLDLIMPGYTHLQPAQPILYSHWLMSYFWMLDRDRLRLEECASRVNISPLGAGALSGNPFPIDREALAIELGMNGVTLNSLDAVSDRDFIAEFLFSASLIGVHLSRLAEDLIIYSSPAYGFVSIGEAYATGSSLMPQKRNPDSLELTRGKSARLIGSLVNLLTLLKGLPSTYNKDVQEDKEPLFDAVDTLEIMLPVVAGVLETLTPNREAMRSALDEALLATDLANYLVERGVPFREAHHLVGQVVSMAEEQKKSISELSPESLNRVSPIFQADVHAVFDFDQAVVRYTVTGGTAPQAVRVQIAQAKEQLKTFLSSRKMKKKSKAQ